MEMRQIMEKPMKMILDTVDDIMNPISHFLNYTFHS